MTTITLPKKLTRSSEDLIAIPRKEYEEFLRLRLERIPEVKLTPTQKRHIEEARREMAKGNFLTLDELKQKLGLSGRR